jgi:integrase
MAKVKLARSKTADQFYREIGKKENGRPVRIYLGSDETLARSNTTRLEALWAAVEERWRKLDGVGSTDAPFPSWDEETLSLARAIGKGEWTITLEPPEDDPQAAAVWLASLRTHFPMIRVDVADPKPVEEGSLPFIEIGKAEADVEEARHRTTMRDLKKFVKPFGGMVVTKETLHNALDAYKTWTEKAFVDIEGRTTQSGKKQGERAARIKKYAPEMPLSDFGLEEIEAIVEFWRTRPKKPPTKKSPNGSPYAFTLCKHTIRLFKHFIRWLHKEKSFPWKKPVDLDLDRIKIVPDSEIKYKIETYSKEELAILWQYASRFERQLLLLGLNCGFSISEIGTLDWSEIEGDHIKGLRPKTKVYGEFKLWEMTRQALGTPKKKGPVFVTTSGASLIAPTEGNNTSARIPSAWYKLLDRVQRHHPEFRRLGFHHLRKTAGNQVRKIADGETMGVFLRHGKPVKTDSLASAYSNPVFTRVFEAQDKLWELWKDIFTPLDDVELPRKLSPEAIQEIRRLKKQGVQTKKLAEIFGVCADTIRVHCRKKK